MKREKNNEILKRIIFLINYLGLKKYEMAEKIGVSNAHFSNVLNGRYNITDRVISAICETFNVNSEWIINGAGPMFNGAPPADPAAGVSFSLNPAKIPKSEKDIFINNLNNFDETQWALFLSLLKNLMRGIDK